MNEAIGGSGGVRRRPPRLPAVRSVVATTWVTTVPPGTAAVRVLPDACIDLVWSGERLRVAGPDTTAQVEHLEGGGTVLGFQLRPGAATSVLGTPATAVRDGRVDLADLWGASVADRLADELGAATGLDAAADIVEAAIAARVASGLPPDPLAPVVRRSVATGVPLHDLGLSVGLSERHLRRRCTAAFGYGPKVLARILRFGRLVERLESAPDEPLAVLAVETGFADQAHLTHEVGALAGTTPSRLRASLVADPDKTAAP